MGRRPDPARVARGVTLALALALALVVVGAAAASPADFSPYNGEWDGASGLTREARDAGATTTTLVAAADYGRLDPVRTTVLVLSPDRAYDERDAAAVRAFVAAGGTLVVAEDAGPHGDALLAATGATARFDGRPLRDDRFHSASPALVTVRDVTPHPLTRGVDLVTTNYGTAVAPGEATVLLATSPFAYLDADDDGRIDAGEPIGPFAVATVEPVGEGRVVAVADPSAFINAMVVRPGNRAFVRALVTGSGAATVAVDASHAETTPALAVARHAVAVTPTLQAAVLLAGLGLVAAWVVGPEVAARRRERRRRRRRRPRERGWGWAPGRGPGPGADAVDGASDRPATPENAR